MAGANNAQMKAAGWRARDITKARATVGRLSHDAMAEAGFSPRKGFEPVSRAASPAKPASEAPAGWRAAARGEGGNERRAAVAAREAFVQGAARRARMDQARASLPALKEARATGLRARVAERQQAAARRESGTLFEYHAGGNRQGFFQYHGHGTERDGVSYRGVYLVGQRKATRQEAIASAKEAARMWQRGAPHAEIMAWSKK